ncbi:MAG: NupC/NupG family nucleoside CNT transporter [Bacillota bacterium]|jgi:CNT family concentrative nucleoside transporter|uniref:NupC/NupG family nucleoside CNT transporter n=1 Tax=Bacillus sp. RO2 TaxID=2723913 RepID=UPI00145F78C2|nr:NupC/NupG family nucleoside CNT transporter [Bacillus sp. RO2]MEA3320324.1 NupC/NupG family nucleoside CNT transporter [Bacillota bacterium]NMH75416.1 NupC/NupG family nucleoside CNT transporter [Bacillus sp. RO2]
MNNILWGLMGIAVIFAIAFLLSENKRKIKIRTILGGLAIQLLFAFIVLKWELGRTAFLGLTELVQNIINYANEGIGFLFGPVLGNPGSEATGFVFAFHVLTIIIFFSALISVLYYLGIMQVVIRFLGGGLAKLLGTSKTESLSASANIFVGQTEAPLVIRPYIAGMTKSELFAVMTGGLASVAGSVLFGYAALGIPLEYLLAASFMAAPGGLIMAKMLIPETEEPKNDTNAQIGESEEDRATNVIDAAARGASDGLKLALNVGAMLLAFIALIALINGILGGIGGWFGAENFSLDYILGYLFAPLAFVIGIPWSEAVAAGNLIGQKLVLNEFVAYSTFSAQIDMFSEKSVAVIAFALCGFANLSSLAILLGGLGNLAPSRRPDIARLGFRAIIAGTLSNLLSAAIAGMFLF